MFHLVRSPVCSKKKPSKFRTNKREFKAPRKKKLLLELKLRRSTPRFLDNKLRPRRIKRELKWLPEGLSHLPGVSKLIKRKSRQWSNKGPKQHTQRIGSKDNFRA